LVRNHLLIVMMMLIVEGRDNYEGVAGDEPLKAPGTDNYYDGTMLAVVAVVAVMLVMAMVVDNVSDHADDDGGGGCGDDGDLMMMMMSQARSWQSWRCLVVVMAEGAL